MTLYETIFTRRQVRKFDEMLLEEDVLADIRQCIQEAEQLEGQQVKVELATKNEVTGGQGAPYYLLSYCDKTSSAYANAGFVLQKADLYIQSMGLGSGWFAGVKPKHRGEDFCIALAFGKTEVPARKSLADFKRKAVEDISTEVNAVAEAVRLAPSAVNSQPWQLAFDKGIVTITDAGSGIKRVLLQKKLNKIDLGIAARHAVLALIHEGNTVTEIIPKETGKLFEIDITYR